MVGGFLVCTQTQALGSVEPTGRRSSSTLQMASPGCVGTWLTRKVWVAQEVGVMSLMTQEEYCAVAVCQMRRRQRESKKCVFFM